MSLEISASLLVDSSGMWTYTLTIFSAKVHVVLIYQCRILSAIKAHSIMLVTHRTQSSHQRFILRHHIIHCLINRYLLFHIVYYCIIFLFLGYTLQPFFPVSISFKGN